MTQTIRVSLPTYDALTDTNPDHFALYADSDWVLIKEKTRGNISIANGGSQDITHNLGYVPYFSVYVDLGTSRQWVGQYNPTSGGYYKAYATTTVLHLINLDSVSRNYLYYIFYDQQI